MDGRNDAGPSRSFRDVRRRSADRDRRRRNGRTAQVHVRATVRTNGVASAEVTPLGHGSKPRNPVTCGTQAKVCFRGPVLPDDLRRRAGPPPVCRRNRHAGCPYANACGRRGRGIFAQSFRTPLRGKGTGRPASPGADAIEVVGWPRAQMLDVPTRRSLGLRHPEVYLIECQRLGLHPDADS